MTGVPDRRVAEVCDQVGLAEATDRRVGGDPAGMAWLRGLLGDLAEEGRTILLSSHLLSEVAQTVDQVVIIHQGRLRFAGPWRTWATWRPPSCTSPTPTNPR